MRTYWLKILLGAAAVFAVGMVVRAMVRSARTHVEAVSEGTGPITIPMAFVPFKIDGQRAGTFRQVRIFRDSLQDPTRVEVLISVADSVSSERFSDCILGVQGDSGKVVPNEFRCLTAADTAGKGLVQVGALELRGRTGNFPLFAPAASVEEFRRGSAERLSADEQQARDLADSIREARADSIHAYADSVHEAGRAAAEALRNAPLEEP